MQIHRRTYVIVVPLLLAVLITGCRRDEPIMPEVTKATLRVRIEPNWNGVPFQRYAEYRDWQNYRVKVDMLRFYLSDLRLVNGDGEVPIGKVALVDMDHGPFEFDLKVPKGNWWGMRIGLGLYPALNGSSPGLYANEHPLSVNNGMYWSWANGYKFVLLDGRYDTDPMGTGTMPGLLSIHTGLDTCYAEVGLFPGTGFATTIDSVSNITIHLAVDRFLYSPAEAVDLGTEYQSHGGNVPLALKLTRNVVRSMTAEIR